MKAEAARKEKEIQAKLDAQKAEYDRKLKAIREEQLAKERAEKERIRKEELSMVERAMSWLQTQTKQN